jgi:hypothetical protein
MNLVNRLESSSLLVPLFRREILSELVAGEGPLQYTAHSHSRLRVPDGTEP